jgi:hypothetical protein
MDQEELALDARELRTAGRLDDGVIDDMFARQRLFPGLHVVDIISIRTDNVSYTLTK